MAYEIQKFVSDKISAFIFWGNGKTLTIKQGKSKRTFFAYHIVSNSIPMPEGEWSLSEYEFKKSKCVHLPKGGTLDFINDEYGNKYYEITNII